MKRASLNLNTHDNNASSIRPFKLNYFRMKRINFLIIGIFALVAFGCNQREKQEIARLNIENQNLVKASQLKDSSVNNIMISLNEIENNLSEIKAKESVISIKSKNNQDLTPDVRARINDDVKDINELMTKNKQAIVWLRKQMKDSNLKIDELSKMIEQLNTQIAERDVQIASLKDDLTKMNFSIASLNASLDTVKSEKAQLQSTVQDKTTALNTAYFITGSQKELLADNIIIKEGGIIGINSTTVLKTDFNNSKFSKIDITQLKNIDINSKKVKLVTSHPAGSYQLNPNKDGLIEKLEITNPEKFWSTSRYLVVLIN